MAWVRRNPSRLRCRRGVIIVAEQLGGHRIERTGIGIRYGREATPIGIVHRRFVVDDQNAHLKHRRG
jgi:hypothetical protein